MLCHESTGGHWLKVSSTGAIQILFDSRAVKCHVLEISTTNYGSYRANNVANTYHGARILEPPWLFGGWTLKSGQGKDLCCGGVKMGLLSGMHDEMMASSRRPGRAGR